MGMILGSLVELRIFRSLEDSCHRMAYGVELVLNVCNFWKAKLDSCSVLRRLVSCNCGLHLFFKSWRMDLMYVFSCLVSGITQDTAQLLVSLPVQVLVSGNLTCQVLLALGGFKPPTKALSLSQTDFTIFVESSVFRFLYSSIISDDDKFP